MSRGFPKRPGADADAAPHPTRYSIRPALIGLVMACMLPSIGAFGIVVGQDYRQQRREIERETLSSARTLAATIDRVPVATTPGTGRSPRERLPQVLARVPLPPGWTAAIVDPSGAVVARSSGTERATDAGDRGTDPDFLARLAARPEGTFDDASPDGTRMIASYTRSANFVVVVGAPRSALFGRLAGPLGGLAAAGAGMLGLALWIALRLAHAVTRSVEGLIEPALALGSGLAVDVPPTRVREVHAVGQAIGEAARMLAAAKHQAHHDALTGLCNRLLFDEVAFHQFASARRAGRRLALLAIDLDGFKAVNDLHGHAAGDSVLRHAAERIRRTIRASDVVSRRGGDEFTVLLGDVGQVLTRQIGEKLVAALAEPYSGIDTPVSASIGIAIFPESGTTVDELLARADEALYAAKHAGKRRVRGDA